MESIIAIDIETTGLDPDKDKIIEIGAVKFNDNRIEAEWSTLINPGRPIPPNITQLTGITDQMVVHAPAIRDVIHDLSDFVGNAHLLGHNIRFDLSFLQQQKIFQKNLSIDTYELAAVLMPTAPRYNLGSLGQALGVLLPATHRALDDAQATRGVYLRLYEEAKRLPLDLLAEIVHLSEPLDWGAYLTFRQVLRSRSKEIVSAEQVRHGYRGPIFTESIPTLNQPLKPRESIIPLDIEEISANLEHGGKFDQQFPHYEYRSQQVAMLRSVSKALSEGRHLMVEAGTGTGKSMAYLIPAAFWALQNGSRVVISTNTINLQDQLVNKDIPDLKNILGLDLNTAVIKGRSNYLCPRRLENFRKRGPENADEMRVLAKILVWLQTTKSGDRAELNLNSPADREIWMKISSEDEGCMTETCLKRTGGICPFYQIHQAAQSAHLLIVNHALLLADVATGNRILPNYDYIIIDEAHHLEEATTNALSYHITQADIDRLLREVGGPNGGTLGRILAATKDILPPVDFASLNHLVQQATDHAFRIENVIRLFFTSIDQFIYEEREGKPLGPYPHQERIVPASRTQPGWADVELAWDDVENSLLPMRKILELLMQGLAENISQIADEDEELLSGVSNLLRRFIDLHDNIHALVFEPQPDQIYWIEMRNEGRNLSIHAAPLHIGALMQKFLWHEKTSIILTSATLTTAGEFNYLRGRLFGEDADELLLGSPFDFETSTLVYLVNDIPEPTDRYNYQRAVETGLVHLCKATGGRAMVLFTSYEQLKRTSQSISPILAKDDIIVFEQGEGASPHSLLESFRTTERAVLLGTRAFWEGVDVPGEALSMLVIAKLPFDVPTDPIVSARAETYDDPFYQYSLPEAILRFRQGFGRLIRTRSDRGVVVILDRRILTKRYGRAFIDSLPICTFQTGPLSNAPRTIHKWLNL